MNKAIPIAAVLMAAVLTGIFSASAYASVAGDESATNTEQEIAQENDGSGESTNNNCALNSIDSAAATVACPVTSGLPTRLPPAPGG
jgi:hypothetical protein